MNAMSLHGWLKNWLTGSRTRRPITRPRPTRRARPRFEALEDRLAPAASFNLVADLNQAPKVTVASELVPFAGTIYFVGQDDVHGTELWRLNPASGKAEIAADIVPGVASSNPSSLTVAGNDLYFITQPIGLATQLWRLDGNGALATLPATFPSALADVNGVLYLSNFTTTDGQELFRVANNTLELVADVTANGSSFPGAIAGDATTVYWTVRPGPGQDELWAKPGGGSPFRVAAGLAADELTLVNGTLYFRVTTAANAHQLWTVLANGTAAQVLDAGGASVVNADHLIDVGGRLWFTADGAGGNELWKIADNGTAVPGADINPGGSSNPSFPVVVNGILYVSADDGTSGREPWQVTPDGTATRVADLIAGPTGSQPEWLAGLNGALYLNVANPAAAGLWKVVPGGTASRIPDATPANLGSFPRAFTRFNNTLYFTADDGVTGTELWKLDAAGNPVRVSDINPGSGDSGVSQLTVAGGTLYFSAFSLGTGFELYKLDAAGNPVRVADLNPGPAGSLPSQLTVSGGTLYFQAQPSFGVQLYKIDANGNPAPVRDGAGNVVANPDWLTDVNGTLWFSAFTAANGIELWKLDSQGVAVRVTDLVSGTGSSTPRALLNANGTILFDAFNGSARAMYKIDASGNAVQVSTAQLSVFSTTSAWHAAVGTTTYFEAFDLNAGAELFKADANGIVSLAADIVPGLAGSTPDWLTVSNGTLYFTATTAATGTELFRLNTAGNAVLVADINPGTGGSNPVYVTDAAGTVYFWANDGTHGEELYRVSGVTGTPELVNDFAPGTGGSADFSTNPLRPPAVVSFNGTVYLRASDGVHGQELWRLLPNRPPTDIGLTAAQVAENQPAGTPVGSLFGTDPDDPANSLTFTLVDDAGGAFVLQNGQIRTNAVFDFETKPSYTITVQATDPFGASFQKALVITVADINETPTAVSLAANPVPESAPTGTLVGTLSGTDPDAGDSLTFSLTDDAGGAFVVVGTDLRTSKTFDFETKTSYTITVRATDRRGLFVEAPFTIRITNTNEAPTGVSLSSGVAENSPVGTLVGILGAFDPDANDTHTFTLIDDAGGSFTLSGNQLRTNAVFDFETRNSYTIVVKATDSGGLSVQGSVTVNITNVNEPPTGVTLQGTSVAENLPPGTVVGTLAATDPDAGSTFTFSIVGTSPFFQVQGNQLKTTSSLNFEATSSYTLTIRATDNGGSPVQSVFTISVTDVNEPPTSITLSAATVPENQPAGTVVGTLAATDPDANNGTSIFSLADDSGGEFVIQDNQLRTAVPLDLKQINHRIVVRATDGGGLSIDRAFSITVTDVNQAPTDIRLSNTTVGENEPAGTVVGTLSAVDPDAGGSQSFTLLNTAGGQFAISGGRLVTAVPLDFEAGPTRTIRVRATDQGGLTFDKDFVIRVADVDEGPFADAFNRPDAAHLGAPWVEPAGSVALSGGRAVVTSPIGLATVQDRPIGDVDLTARLDLPTTGTQYGGLVARHQGVGDTNLFWGAVVLYQGKYTAEIWRNLNGTWLLLSRQTVGTGTGDLRFQVVGNSLKLWLNGALVGYAFDNALAGPGRYGVRGLKNAALDDFAAQPVVPAVQTIGFSDTFDQPTGSQLDPTAWQGRVGNYSVADNQVRGDSPINLATIRGIAASDVALSLDVALTAAGVQYTGLVARYGGPGTDTNMYWGAVVGVNGAYTAEIWRNLNGTWTLLTRSTLATGAGTLQFLAAGDSLRLVFNGALVASANDAALATGGVGVRGLGGTRFDNFDSAPYGLTAAALPFTDGFTGTGGAPLGTTWHSRSGGFALQDDTAVSTAAISLATLQGVMVANSSTRIDVNLPATGVQHVGLVARYQGIGDRNLYYGALVAVDGVFTAEIWKTVNGTPTRLASAAVGAGTGTLRFDVTGTGLQLYLDGTLAAQATDAEFATGGLGIRGSRGATADNYQAQ
jgi:ELWxxDGT repeat protein